ncbi:carboxypeptidase-like regulatory domain-containing protein [Olleya sp. YS]|uniref:carboxypeptidase-like regulatory domain-containing protein n=1 Tax=Olleya sp. YS TaxID=3028318 RepID=UPI002434469E|nr:carboxypeptidase-like regulatory domain-containing protein [Olleya sp. YS]WGD35347.1 carboxypeptidase-like regulatory domain-containing protein [Olleya sp. YS]
MKTYLIAIFLLAFTFVNAQDSTRVEIKGKIIVASPDLEGISVYNSSSNQGTVTDANGEFTISAMLNDKINIHALQFKDFNVAVAQDVIDSKQMNVFLVEQVNKLDEVVILSYDLTGILKEDVANAETFNPDMDAIYFGVDDISLYEFSNDQYSKVENLAAMSQNDRIRYQANGMAILSGLVGLIFKKKNKKKSTDSNVEEVSSLGDTYTHEYFTVNFKIPEEKVEAFIAHVETNGFDTKLLENGKEMQLIEYLHKQSQEFLKPVVEKD